jgi:hypothetical protein
VPRTEPSSYVLSREVDRARLVGLLEALRNEDAYFSVEVRSDYADILQRVLDDDYIRTPNRQSLAERNRWIAVLYWLEKSYFKNEFAANEVASALREEDIKLEAASVKRIGSKFKRHALQYIQRHPDTDKRALLQSIRRFAWQESIFTNRILKFALYVGTRPQRGIDERGIVWVKRVDLPKKWREGR